MSDNYPDDMRQFDNTPGSPYYNQPTCPHCGEDLDDGACPECDRDPTPWCTCCGSMTKQGCNCGPIAENN